MKQFLIINNHVYLEDVNGINISFNSKEDYAIYTGKVAPTDPQMTYSPSEGIYTSFDGTTELDLSASIPVADLEDSIANIEQYKFNTQDPYFSKGLTEAKYLKYDEVKVYAQQIADDAELVPHVTTTYTDLEEARADRFLAAELLSFKMASSVTLSGLDVTKAEVYYALSQFRSAVNAEAVASRDTIIAILNIQDVKNFNVQTSIVWSVWVPVGS